MVNIFKFFFTQCYLYLKYISHKFHYTTHIEIFKELHVMDICMYSYDNTNVKDVC